MCKTVLRPTVRLTFILLALLTVAGGAASACSEEEGATLILATTTSTHDSGLLDVLLPVFEEEAGITVKPIAVGSGAAMEMGRSGDADVLLVHSPAAEAKFVEEGYGVRRTRVMYNDFILVGPPGDPAGIGGMTDPAAAMAAIFEAGATFYTRGDSSGTHAKELALWGAAGADPAGRPWYRETGQGMSATLTIAGESAGYTLTDRATWLAVADPAVLPLHVEGDSLLFNVYHVIVVNPERFPGLQLNTRGADQLREFLVSDRAQDIIASFGRERFGQALFVPYPEEAGARRGSWTRPWG